MTVGSESTKLLSLLLFGLCRDTIEVGSLSGAERKALLEYGLASEADSELVKLTEGLKGIPHT